MSESKELYLRDAVHHLKVGGCQFQVSRSDPGVDGGCGLVRHPHRRLLGVARVDGSLRLEIFGHVQLESRR